MNTHDVTTDGGDGDEDRGRDDLMRPPAGPNGAASPGVMFRWGLYVSLAVLAVLVAAAAVYTTRAVLVRVVIALFIAVSLDPAVRVLTHRGMRRSVAVLVIFAVAGGLTAAFLISVIPALVSQFQSLVHDFPGYVASLSDRSSRFRQLTDRFHLTTKVQDLIADLPGRLGGGALGFTRRVFGALFDTLTVVVLAIYFMADMPRLRQNAMRLFPRARRAQAVRIADVTVDKVGSYMIGDLLISLVGSGSPPSPPSSRCRCRSRCRWRCMVAVCDLIPMIGATLGAVVCVAAALLTTEPMAHHGDRGRLLRPLPAGGELPRRAADPAADGRPERGRVLLAARSAVTVRGVAHGLLPRR